MLTAGGGIVTRSWVQGDGYSSSLMAEKQAKLSRPSGTLGVEPSRVLATLSVVRVIVGDCPGLAIGVTGMTARSQVGARELPCRSGCQPGCTSG